MSKTSIIPEGVTLEGDIEGRGDLVVAGTVDGPIDIEGTLVVEEGAQVRGDVTATSVRVRGVVAGTVAASEFVVIEPSAIVVGDARAARVQIVEGARFRGRVQMTGEPAPRRRRRRAEPAERLAAEAPPASALDADTIPGTLRSPAIDTVAEEPRAEQAGAVENRTDGAADSKSPAQSKTTDEESASSRSSRSGSKRRRGRRRPRRGRRDEPRAESSGESERPRRTRRRPSRDEADRGPSERGRSERDPSERGRSEQSRPQRSAATSNPKSSEGPAPARKRGRRPPPPTIPSVSRQKARRKDRGEPSP